MEKVTLKVFRYDHTKKTPPTYVTYKLDLEEGMTLQMSLRQIYDKLDRTLAFRNFSCGMGPLCGACMVRLNKKNVYACSMPVKGGEELLVEPVQGFRLVKDLVVDWGRRINRSSF